MAWALSHTPRMGVLWVYYGVCGVHRITDLSDLVLESLLRPRQPKGSYLEGLDPVHPVHRNRSKTAVLEHLEGSSQSPYLETLAGHRGAS